MTAKHQGRASSRPAAGNREAGRQALARKGGARLGRSANRSALDRGEMVSVERAGSLAARILRGNTRRVRVVHAKEDRTLLLASTGHFAAAWTRDAMFASLGALSRGDTLPVRDTLQSLIDAQSADGQLPRRIGATRNSTAVTMNSLFGVKPNPKKPFRVVEYKSGLGHEVIDSNTLVIWLAAEYAAKSGDREFVRKNLGALESAMRWLDARGDGGLLDQAAYGDWKDTIARRGKVLYSNALYYRAALGMAELSALAGRAGDSARYSAQADSIRADIQKVFWRPGKGRFRDTDELEHFSADGNFLAVYFGIARGAQAEQIIERAEAHLRRPSGLYALIDRAYPASMIPVGARLIGLGGYGNTAMMTWNTSLFAMAAARAGRVGAAEKALAAVAHLAERDGTFSEYYEERGSAEGAEDVRANTVPLQRRFYRSEENFSWSAGMFLRAAEDVANARSSL